MTTSIEVASHCRTQRNSGLCGSCRVEADVHRGGRGRSSQWGRMESGGRREEPARVGDVWGLVLDFEVISEVSYIA